MTWQPKYLDMKIKAQEISTRYRELLENNSSRDSVKTLSEEFNLAEGSIYRYLRSQGINAKGRNKSE